MAVAVVIWGIVLLASLGLGTAMVAGARSPLRARLWLGLSLVLIVGTALSLKPPTGVTSAFLVALAIAALVGIVLVLSKLRGSTGRVGTYLAVVVTVGAGAVIASWMAIGEVRNYDTGLYHLQLIALAATEGTPAGIAQLHDRFGFTSSLWSIGGQFEVVAGSTVGFRLISGLFLILLVVEIVGRFATQPMRARVGTWILAVGFVPVAAYGISYAGRTFAGVGQDWIFAVLWLVATAYLADWLQYRRAADVGTAIVVSSLAGSVRPFGWLLLVTVIVIACVFRRASIRDGFVLWWAAILTALWITVTAVRDALASGWLLFPFGLFPFPVPWRLGDPSRTAEAVTLWARAPFDMESATSGWSWLSDWVVRMGTDWFVVWLICSLASAAILIVFRSRATHVAGESERLTFLVILTVQCLALGLWFASAPDPRFGWGPLAALSGVLVAWAAGPGIRQSISSRAGWVLWLPLGMVAVSVALSITRDPGWWFDRNLEGAPVPVVPVPVVDVEIINGIARTVGPDDRCWRTAVPCVPWYEDTN